MDYHRIVNVSNNVVESEYLLAEVLATAKDQIWFTALNLAMLKAFFGRVTAMVWPEAATTCGTEADRVKRVTGESHVTCRPPP